MTQFFESIIPVVAIIGFFGSIVVWLYLFFNSRHKERMALIESGKDATIFQQGNRHRSNLKNGVVAGMTGIGLLVGYLLESLGLPGFVAYSSMVLLLGGAGLIGYYFFFSKEAE